MNIFDANESTGMNDCYIRLNPDEGPLIAAGGVIVYDMAYPNDSVFRQLSGSDCSRLLRAEAVGEPVVLRANEYSHYQVMEAIAWTVRNASAEELDERSPSYDTALFQLSGIVHALVHQGMLPATMLRSV